MASRPRRLRSPSVHPAHRLWRNLSAIVLWALLGGAGNANAQTVDSLTALLASSNTRVRGSAVVKLGYIPAASLPARTRAALISLLEREALGQVTTLESPAPDDEDESWSEYILELTDLVVRLGDTHALRGVALLGIQTSLAAQEFVAGGGSQALPALDEAWSLKPDARPSVIATWGLMLRRSSSIDTSTRLAILAKLLAPSDTFPIALSFAARNGQLVALVPVMDSIAATASDRSVILAARRASEILSPLYAAASTSQLLSEIGLGLDALCVNPQGAMNGFCNPSQNHLDNAIKQLKTNHTSQAVNALESLIAKAVSAVSNGLISPIAGQLLVGNTRRVIARLGP